MSATPTHPLRALSPALALACAALCLACCGDDASAPSDDGGAIEAGVAYVDGGAQQGGDGSKARPVRTLEEALGLERDVTRVVLASGSYTLPAPWSFDSAITLEGASPDATFLSGATDATTAWTAPAGLTLTGATVFGALQLTGGALAFNNVRFDGDTAGLVIEDAQSASLDACAFASGVGLTLTRVAAADVRTTTLEGGLARLRAEAIPALTLANVSVRGVVGPGVALIDTTATATDLTLEDIAEENDLGGDGLAAQRSDLTWTGGVVARVADRCVALTESRAVMSGLTLVDGGRAALSVQLGADATLSDSVLGRTMHGVFVSASALQAQNIQVSDTRGSGLLTGDASSVTLADSTFTRCPGGHVSLIGATSSATLTGNTFDDANPETCVSISGTQADVIVRDNIVRSCGGTGVAALGSTKVVIADNTISDIAPDPIFQSVADGINLVDSVGEITGNTISEADNSGIAFIRSSATVSGNTLRQLGASGISLLDAGPSRSVIDDNTIEDVASAGVVILGDFDTIEADVTNNRISRVTLDAAVGLGDGVAFGQKADVNVTGNTISDCGANGVLFVAPATGSVSNNTLTNNAYYGVRGFCDADTQVTIAPDNTYDGNALGDASGCE